MERTGVNERNGGEGCADIKGLVRAESRQRLVSLLNARGFVKEESLTPEEAARGKSRYYVGIKDAFGDPEARLLIVGCLRELIPAETTCTVGKGYGGAPLADALASAPNRYRTLIGDRPDKHSDSVFVGHRLRGDGDKRDRVAIFDDVRDSGRSLKEMGDLIRSTGAELLCYIIVYDRVTGNAATIDGVPVLHVMTPEDLRQYADLP